MSCHNQRTHLFLLSCAYKQLLEFADRQTAMSPHSNWSVWFVLFHDVVYYENIVFQNLPMSRHLCLAVCCLECQYFQCFSWSSLHFSSPNTIITTL